MKLLIVDNNDSFTYNLLQMVEETGLTLVDVVNHADVILKNVAAYDKILFSPGPSLPDDFPVMKQILKTYGEDKSILGICMGLQAISEFYGGRLMNLTKVVHGQKHQLNIIKEDTIFENIPKNSNIGLYHSWAVKPGSLPKELEILATDQNGIIMAIRHKTFDVKGLQFHPESIITTYGERILSNWLMS